MIVGSQRRQRGFDLLSNKVKVDGVDHGICFLAVECLILDVGYRIYGRAFVAMRHASYAFYFLLSSVLGMAWTYIWSASPPFSFRPWHVMQYLHS